MKEYGKADEVADAYLGKVQVDKQAEEEVDPESRWTQVAMHTPVRTSRSACTTSAPTRSGTRCSASRCSPLGACS